VRDNALCVVANDAKSCKIKHIALPDDGDAANKRYVLQSMQILKDWQNEIEKKIATFQIRANYDKWASKDDLA